MFKYIKSFVKNYSDWDDFMSTVNFYRFNPHSIPAVSKLLCRMGRHDFMPCEVLANDHVVIECFYCLRKKSCKFSRE